MLHRFMLYINYISIKLGKKCALLVPEVKPYIQKYPSDTEFFHNALERISILIIVKPIMLISIYTVIV